MYFARQDKIKKSTLNQSKTSVDQQNQQKLQNQTKLNKIKQNQQNQTKITKSNKRIKPGRTAGHGGENFLKFQDADIITSRELGDNLHQMHARGRLGCICT